jgi:hypothetical protein
MNSDEKQKIKAIIMLEVIGKPPEHLVDALEDLIKNLDEEKGVEVQKKDIKKPRPMEKKIGITTPEGETKSQSEFYTTFAEVEIELEEISLLAYLMFKYMPAHIEIISPALVSLTNNGWNELFNELSRRLHGYNEVARVLQVEKDILERKLKVLMGKEENKEEYK